VHLGLGSANLRQVAEQTLSLWDSRPEEVLPVEVKGDNLRGIKIGGICLFFLFATALLHKDLSWGASFRQKSKFTLVPTFHKTQSIATMRHT